MVHHLTRVVEDPVKHLGCYLRDSGDLDMIAEEVGDHSACASGGQSVQHNPVLWTDIAAV